MKKIVLALFSLVSVSLSAQSVAQQRCDRLANGLNLHNWLEDFWSPVYHPDPNLYTRADIRKMREAGMRSLRLPVCFVRVTDSIPPYAVDTLHPVFAIIDSVIQWAKDEDMMLIIDNHHAWDIYDYNWRQKIDRFAHLWSVLSYKYKDLDPNRYMFELLNEPAFGINMDTLRIVFNHAIDSIRQHTTAHSIVVSPNFSSNGAAFNGLVPFADTNLIYTWHTYDPYQFTHQGFTWASPYFPQGYCSFPSPYDAMLTNAWNGIINWRNTYHLPVFLGEFGVGEFADADSRCRWIEYMGAKIDSFQMPWMYWDWDDGFTWFYSKTLVEDSVIPCFKRALHLYGDSSVSAVESMHRSSVHLQLAPNPTYGAAYCHIRVYEERRPLSLTVLDLAGRTVLETTFTNEYDLDTKGWSKGMYLLKLQTQAGAMAVKKLVVE